jgi:hypothetical protein
LEWVRKWLKKRIFAGSRKRKRIDDGAELWG